MRRGRPAEVLSYCPSFVNSHILEACNRPCSSSWPPRQITTLRPCTRCRQPGGGHGLRPPSGQQACPATAGAQQQPSAAQPARADDDPCHCQGGQSLQAHQAHLLAMAYDARICSFPTIDRVSLLTRDGRVEIPFRFGAYAESWLTRSPASAWTRSSSP